MPVPLVPLADARADALALWEGADVRTPFAHPAFVEAAGTAFGLPAVVALAEGAAVLGLVRTRGPVRALVLPPGVTYTAPLVAMWPQEADTVRRATPLDALAGSLPAHLAQATLALPPDWPDARPFAWNGWTLGIRYTALADLTGDPVARWSQGTRQRVGRHAEAYEVREGAPEADAAARLQAETYDRKGLPLGVSEATLARLGRTMVDLGLARAFGAYREGTCEAAALFTVDGRRALYWLSGGLPGPGTVLLLAHAMGALGREGADVLDLGGANVPSVAQFKRQIGGRLAPVVVARWVGPRWLRALQALRP